MTYNFDPDRWYENHRALLESRRVSGQLDEAAYQQALCELGDEYDAMVERLDGTYQLPGNTT